MTVNASLPENLVELVRCSCKKGCNTNRCSCRKASLPCTSACLCSDHEECENNVTAYEQEDFNC